MLNNTSATNELRIPTLSNVSSGNSGENNQQREVTAGSTSPRRISQNKNFKEISNTDILTRPTLETYSSVTFNDLDYDIYQLFFQEYLSSLKKALPLRLVNERLRNWVNERYLRTISLLFQSNKFIRPSIPEPDFSNFLKHIQFGIKLKFNSAEDINDFIEYYSQLSDQTFTQQIVGIELDFDIKEEEISFEFINSNSDGTGNIVSCIKMYENVEYNKKQNKLIEDLIKLCPNLESFACRNIGGTFASLKNLSRLKDFSCQDILSDSKIPLPKSLQEFYCESIMCESFILSQDLEHLKTFFCSAFINTCITLPENLVSLEYFQCGDIWPHAKIILPKNLSNLEFFHCRIICQTAEIHNLPDELPKLKSILFETVENEQLRKKLETFKKSLDKSA